MKKMKGEHKIEIRNQPLLFREERIRIDFIEEAFLSFLRGVIIEKAAVAMRMIFQGK